MRERFSALALARWLCLIMACLLIYQVVGLFRSPQDDGLSSWDNPWSFAATSAAMENSSSTTPATQSPSQSPLPAEIQSQIDLIDKSGIFGALPQPLPLALLGIGGQDAFIRTATGQTGLLRVGEELGGVKLLRIGINQIVVEENGQERTLSLFPGLDKPSSGRP